MIDKSVIFCFVFGGLIIIGAAAATLIEDHTVRWMCKVLQQITSYSETKMEKKKKSAEHNIALQNP